MAIIAQGTFTQGATAQTIRLPLVSDVDRFTVYNKTQMAASQTTAVGVQYYWQRGFPAGAQVEYLKSNAANAANLIQYLTTGGFTLIDSTNQQPGPLDGPAGNADITAISAAAIPVVTNNNTNFLSAGNVVRLFSTAGATQIGGMDFTVGYNTLGNTTFSLDYMAQIVAGTTGHWRLVPFNPIFYPRNRYITSISQAAQAVVVTSVTHGFQLGMKITFRVPKAFGMVEMDTLEGTIVAVNTATTGAGANSFTVDIDSSAFTAFSFPLTGTKFTPAQAIPDGMNTAFAANNNLNQLVDATVNVGYIGIQLAAGANSPAGIANDVIYWVAEKADSVNTIVPVSLSL